MAAVASTRKWRLFHDVWTVRIRNSCRTGMRRCTETTRKTTRSSETQNISSRSTHTCLAKSEETLNVG
jgi:hypothetical protein